MEYMTFDLRCEESARNIRRWRSREISSKQFIQKHNKSRKRILPKLFDAVANAISIIHRAFVHLNTRKQDYPMTKIH